MNKTSRLWFAGCFCGTSLLASSLASAQTAADAPSTALGSTTTDGIAFEASPRPASPQPDSAAPTDGDDSKQRRDVRRELPIAAFAYSAEGAAKGTMGAQGFGLGLVASGQSATLGGGVTAWGAPLTRLTLVLDAQRNMYGNFSPSGAALVHLLGDRHRGWSLGALGKFKIDGFASGPNKDEVESELELGALVSFVELGWRLDLNAVAGRGLGDDGETDAESRLRFGRELGDMVWLGLDGQARLRVGGPRTLPNGKTWDFAAGPQVLIGSGSFFAVLTAGPATMGLLSPNLGFTSLVGIGGTT